MPETLQKIFEDLFFFGERLNFAEIAILLSEDLFLENTSTLCSWPWPRAFLSLATKGYVLGDLFLALASDFFASLASPCVLDSTSVI